MYRKVNLFTVNLVARLHQLTAFRCGHAHQTKGKRVRRYFGTRGGVRYDVWPAHHLAYVSPYNTWVGFLGLVDSAFGGSCFPSTKFSFQSQTDRSQPYIDIAEYH
jgi:hypothetical protein